MKFQDSFEYRLLPIPFTVLTLCGTWYPENWMNEEKRIYKYFSVTILSLGILLFVEMLVKIVQASGTDEFNLENVFATLVFAIGVYKKISILYTRQNIVDFIRDYTNNQWFKPQNMIEITIHKKIQTETRRVSIMYAVFIGIAILFRSIIPILEAGTFITLPLDGWYPYEVNNFIIFMLTYCHQIISGVTLTCMHLSTDTLFVGLLLQMSFQLNILKRRLRNFGSLNNDKNKIMTKTDNEMFLKAMIAQRAREHESIYRFGEDMQKIFKPILMGQMIVVVPNLMINIYFLSVYNDRLNLKYFMTFFFTLVPLMQIYMFCWYSNEIFLDSIDVGDAMYECNWTALNQSTKKTVLTIITRTSNSILITAGTAIPLNIDMFIKIMKTSYSAFNLLQQTTAH